MLRQGSAQACRRLECCRRWPTANSSGRIVYTSVVRLIAEEWHHKQWRHPTENDDATPRLIWSPLEGRRTSSCPYHVTPPHERDYSDKARVKRLGDSSNIRHPAIVVLTFCTTPNGPLARSSRLSGGRRRARSIIEGGPEANPIFQSDHIGGVFVYRTPRNPLVEIWRPDWRQLSAVPILLNMHQFSGIWAIMNRPQYDDTHVY